MTKAKWATLLAVAVLCGGAAWYAFTERAADGAFTDLDPRSFAGLKNEFNAAAGKVRVVVLLSPT